MPAAGVDSWAVRQYTVQTAAPAYHGGSSPFRLPPSAVQVLALSAAGGALVGTEILLRPTPSIVIQSIHVCNQSTRSQPLTSGLSLSTE